MASSQSESVLNGVLIDMARGFLQYVDESWPWVDKDHLSVKDQMAALAARQRQDVRLIAELLMDREWAIDFGSFPTEYTDMHFISLAAMLQRIQHSQAVVNQRLHAASESVGYFGDEEAAQLLSQITIHETELLSALKDLQQEFGPAAATV